MKTRILGLDSSLKIAAIIALVISAVSPILLNSSASAVGIQVSNRYVKMSSSTPSATGVTYEIGFTPSATSTLSLVIDFCSDGPILNSTCTSVAGTGVPQFTGAATPGTGGTGVMGAWTSSTLTGGRIKLNGVATANTTATAQVIKVTGVTNPSVTASFYARITTYADAAYGAGSAYTNATTLGNYIDYGGMAMSTATAISISATVQETLTFCVSLAFPGAACTGTSAPTLVLGTGSPKVLSASVDTGTVYYQVSHNAGGTGGVTIRMRGDTLKNGTPSIPAANTANGALNTITGGTAAFGMRIGTTAGTLSTDDYSSGGETTIDANYLSATQYGFDITTGTNNIILGAGDPIATVTAGANKFAKLTFAATISPTTPAGFYTATETLIATGTY